MCRIRFIIRHQIKQKILYSLHLFQPHLHLFTYYNYSFIYFNFQKFFYYLNFERIF